MLADLKQHARAHRDRCPTGDGVLAALDALMQRTEDTLGPLWLLPAVHPAKAVRDAAEACDLAYQGFSTAFLQNATVYARLKQRAAGATTSTAACSATSSTPSRTPASALPAGQAGSACARINTELTRLSQDFDRRIRESRDTRGLHRGRTGRRARATVWKQRHARRARAATCSGWTTRPPTRCCRQAVREATRERMWRATMRAGRRREPADAGRSSRRCAASTRGCSASTRMPTSCCAGAWSKSEAEASRFLAEVSEAVAQRERADLDAAARRQGARDEHGARGHRAAALGRALLHRARARARRYARRPGSLPRATSRPGAAWSSSSRWRSACSACASSRCSRRCGTRRRGPTPCATKRRHAARHAVRRPVPARRQVQPRGGLVVPQRVDAERPRCRPRRWWSTSTTRA